MAPAVRPSARRSRRLCWSAWVRSAVAPRSWRAASRRRSAGGAAGSDAPARVRIRLDVLEPLAESVARLEMHDHGADALLEERQPRRHQLGRASKRLVAGPLLHQRGEALDRRHRLARGGAGEIGRGLGHAGELAFAAVEAAAELGDEARDLRQHLAHRAGQLVERAAISADRPDTTWALSATSEAERVRRRRSSSRPRPRRTSPSSAWAAPRERATLASTSAARPWKPSPMARSRASSAGAKARDSASSAASVRARSPMASNIAGSTRSRTNSVPCRRPATAPRASAAESGTRSGRARGGARGG
jgi:hypothetical protein